MPGQVTTDDEHRPGKVITLVVGQTMARKVHIAFIDASEYQGSVFRHDQHQHACGEGVLVTVPLSHLKPEVLCGHCRWSIEHYFGQERGR